MKLFFALLLCSVSAILAEEPIPERFGLRLEEVQYPFPVSMLTIESQRQPLEMAFMDVAPKNPTGRVVVLLHGKNFNGCSWRSTIEVLTEAGFRVVVPDQIGFGKSSKPEHYQFSFEQLAANTTALLDHLGIEKAAIVGHSMGGMLAARLALRYPSRVEQLALIDPMGLEDWRLFIPYRDIGQWYAEELKATPEQVKKYQTQSYYHGEWKPEYEPWVRLVSGWIGSDDYPRIAWISALAYDMILTQPVCYEFQLLRAPTLLVVGALDRTAIGKQWAPDEIKKQMGNYPKLAFKTAAEIPGCRLEILPGVGHVPQIEAPDRLFPILLKFLENKPRARPDSD